MLTRRTIMMFLLLGLAGQGVPAAFAKDGDGGGGDGGGGGDDGGGDGGGDNSGHGSGGDDGGDDGGGDDSGGDDSDGSGSGSGKRNDDRIRQAVRNGKAQPLRKILSQVRSRFEGEVVRIRLTGSGSRLTYRIRIIDTADQLIEVRVNAGTGLILDSAGVN